MIASIMVIIMSIPLMRIWNIEGIAGAYLITYTIISIYIIIRTENYIEFALRIIRKDRKINLDKNVV